MRAENIIADLRKAISKLEDSGQKDIPTSNLENYLTAVEEIIKDPVSQATETQRHEFTLKHLELNNEQWKVKAQLQATFGVELFRATIEAGQTAIKSAMLMNGAAAVALLAFLGNLLSRQANVGDTILISKINTAMAVFLGGVAFAGLTSGIRYICQALYAVPSRQKEADWAKYFAIIGGFSSIAMFVLGGYIAHLAIS